MITIRQAEQMLVDEGLLGKQQGRGTFVPESARQHLKILGVCGLNLAQGLQRHLGPYFSDLIVLSQQAAVKRGFELEIAWLPTSETDRARRYCEEPMVREYAGFLFFACGPNHLLLQRVDDETPDDRKGRRSDTDQDPAVEKTRRAGMAESACRPHRIM